MTKSIKYWRLNETSGVTDTAGTCRNMPTLNVGQFFDGKISNAKMHSHTLSKAEIVATYKPVKKSVIRRFLANLKKVIERL